MKTSLFNKILITLLGAFFGQSFALTAPSFLYINEGTYTNTNEKDYSGAGWSWNHNSGTLILNNFDGT